MNSNPRSLRAVIFDFDGLILDTETPEYLAWKTIYEQYGATLSIEEWAVCIGTAYILDPHAMLEQRIGRTLDRHVLSEQVMNQKKPLMAKERLRPGVVQVLDEADDMGLKIGLASSSSREWVLSHLEAHHIVNRFHTIKTREDVAQVKPDPALYLRAVETLKVKPHEAIAMEDSLNGLRAAQAAGLFCVAVPNPMTQHLPLHEADLLLSTLAALSLKSLQNQFLRSH